MASVWTVMNSMLSCRCVYVMQIPAETVLQCNRQFAISDLISEFCVFAPVNAAACTFPPSPCFPQPLS